VGGSFVPEKPFKKRALSVDSEIEGLAYNFSLIRARYEQTPRVQK